MKFPRHDKSKRGSNAIEFAMTLPVFALILLGTMDYGWYFMQKAISDGAVVQGCREGSLVDPFDADPTQAADDQMEPLLGILGKDCTAANCDAEDVGEVPFRRLHCSIDYPFEPILDLVPLPERVSSRAVARLEWQRAR